MKKILFSIYMLCLFSAALSAQSEVSRWIAGDLAWYPANLQGYGAEGFAPIDYSTVPLADLKALPGDQIQDEGRDLGGQAFEMRATFGCERRVPFLPGSSALTSDNNIIIRAKGEISPVTMSAEIETVITPVAFFSFDSSLSIGTGWAIGDGSISGLSFNTPEQTFEPAPFEGVVTTADFGGTLQFDFGVLVPGDWTHIVMLYRPSVAYEAFSGAAPDEAWMWKSDDGENYNGWKWEQTAVLGYQMPAFKHLEIAGILVETEQRITKQNASPMDSGGWGSDFTKVYIGPFLVYQLSQAHSLTFQCQFARGRDYTDESIGNAHFSYRKVDTGSPTYWYFRRVALSYRYDY